MIRSFKSKALKRFWEDGDRSGFNPAHITRITERLQVIDAASTLEDINQPGWRFHQLKGAMKGRYSIWVSGNWRITFMWDGQAAESVDVDYIDYH